jgi:cytochrome c2
MNKRIYFLSALVALVLLGMLIAACGAPQEATAPDTLDGKALVEQKCTRCHDLTRVEQAKKTTDEWKATVERMVGHGAQLNADEQKTVIEYLSEAYPK